MNQELCLQIYGNCLKIQNSIFVHYIVLQNDDCKLTLSTWKMRSSSHTFSKHLSNVSTNT